MVHRWIVNHGIVYRELAQPNKGAFLKNLLADNTVQVHIESITERLFLKDFLSKDFILKYLSKLSSSRSNLLLECFYFSAIFEHVSSYKVRCSLKNNKYLLFKTRLEYSCHV